MHKVLIVGENSFLARRFVSSLAVPERYATVPHARAFDESVYRRVACVVNFAIHPAYRDQPYAPEHDVDARIAEVLVRAAPADARYVMLSSRAVYAPDMAKGAREDVTGEAPTVYGRNKRITEGRLAEMLGNRASFLRIANVIGDEHGTGRRTFMAQALDRLAAEKEIRLDISPEVRRDFLPDDYFVHILEAVCVDPPAGPMNVGTGLAVTVGALARWIIEGYGEGALRITDDRRHDEFWLDVRRLRARYGFHIEEAEIAEHCRAIGARLRRRAGGHAR